MGSDPALLDLFDIDFFLFAMRYTLLDQDVLEREFPRCDERGVGIVIGGGYNSGILATGAVPRRCTTTQPPARRFSSGCARSSASARAMAFRSPAAALQFPLGHPIVASIIPGAISRAQVEKNLTAFRHPFRPTSGRSSSTRS